MGCSQGSATKTNNTQILNTDLNINSSENNNLDKNNSIKDDKQKLSLLNNLTEHNTNSLIISNGSSIKKLIETNKENIPQSNEDEEIQKIIKNNNSTIIKEHFEGNLIDNKKEGKGKYYYTNGDIYDGEFKNDLKEGNGTLYYANGDKYTGQFKNDLINGKGTIIYNNGYKFEGNFKDGKKEGKGAFIYHNGDKYECEYKNDQKIGVPKLFVNESNNWKTEKEIINDLLY